MWVVSNDRPGKWIYEKLVSNPNDLNDYSHIKYHIMRLLEENGKVDFEWNEWEPAQGLDGICTLSCGIIQRKMVRSCKTGMNWDHKSHTVCVICSGTANWGCCEAALEVIFNLFGIC